MLRARVCLVFFSFCHPSPPFSQGPTPLPRKTFRRTVLKSPFKYGSARDAWERRSHRRLIVYETDANTHLRFQKFLLSILEPVAALKVTEHSFHEVDNFYRRSVMSGETAALAKQQQ